jgi:hypothetical protein
MYKGWATKTNPCTATFEDPLGSLLNINCEILMKTCYKNKFSRKQYFLSYILEREIDKFPT